MAKAYTHLTVAERAVIHAMLYQGSKRAAIAERLLRPRSCISRELSRNRWRPAAAPRPVGRPPLLDGYSAERAQQRSRTLAAKPRTQRKLLPGNALWGYVVDGLQQGLSPEQIAGTLTRMNAPERLCHETIYRAIYVMPRGVLRTEMIALLRFAHRKRRPRARGKDRRGSIPNMLSIEQRPADVAERLLPGHWEGDRILGKANRSQVGTLVERQSLYVALVKLDQGTAEATAAGFSTILQRFPQELLISVTCDQGREMSQHASITENTGCQVYFAHPHSPWERGINENTNGLLRQYLPKGTDLSVHTQQQLDDIAWKLNVRPRKSLDWKCPAELFLPEGAFDFVSYWSAILKPVALRA
jgi:IS30 family transposase